MINILELDSVILEFGRKLVLHNVYIKSETNKITGLLGRNGSGKTSILDIIYGELIPINKSVRINNKVILT
ncbi:ATP-binding cassette domain-containing protein, partial [Maribacter polysaccharolyticus]|uniref:ATP-binding cassette domain-containing protein n=1 Tax=Maribacter polysaccharolyticus TaxID=3020831 RepID=UPI00237FB9B9